MTDHITDEQYECAEAQRIEAERIIAAYYYPRDPLMETLAHFEHASWARWMDYLFSRCEHHADGSATIPADLVARWKRQAATRYDDLSEREKESDRQEVRHILPMIAGAVLT